MSGNLKQKWIDPLVIPLCVVAVTLGIIALMGESQISFEHAVYLLGALLAGDELRVAHCRDCSGVLVTDRLALRIPVCNECSSANPPDGEHAGASPSPE